MPAPYNAQVAGPDRKFSRPWLQWVELIDRTVRAFREAGPTANRPTARLWVGRQYFDTDLGYPVWYDGTKWVDASGTTA